VTDNATTAKDEDLVKNIELVWRSIDALCGALMESEWKTSTDCPGWSVQDQLSHLAGSESSILGEPRPDHTPNDISFVRNEIGRKNEVLVDWRRPSKGSVVLEEFRDVSARRLALLKAMTPADFDQATETPIGPGAMRDFLAIRLFDAWVHEQDIRRALGKPGHLEGPVAQHSLDRMFLAMPFIVGKKAEAADGASVVFHVVWPAGGPAGSTVAVVVVGTRAKEIEPPPSPSVELTMDLETFTCLGCGRWDPAEVLRSDKVKIDGDRVLGERVIARMSFMI
jgi:uncharacterized protein (TIGR03083 family)